MIRSHVHHAFPLAAALLLNILSGCDTGPFKTSERVESVLDAVVQAAPEAGPALLRDTPGPIGHVEVYVDLSLSVRPYLADAQGSVLRRVLEGMSNGLGGDVSFHGFGFAPGGTSQTVTPLAVGALLTPASYDRVNNDYGVLFDRFRPAAGGAPGPVHVVLTDGVESDPEGGALFGRIVGAADRYVRSGGTFSALVWRAPYNGTYYSEGAACARGALQMACADRPLVAFVFAPSSERLDALLASFGPGGQPVHVLRVGGRDGDLAPVAEIAKLGSRRSDRLLRDAEQVIAEHYRPVTQALVSETAAHDGYVPFTFRLTINPAAEPWRSLSAEARGVFLQSLRPRLRGWAATVVRGDSVALAEFEPDVLDASVTTDTTGALVVTVPTKKPSGVKGRHFAFLLELVPYQTAAQIVPAGLSTPDDCSASTCGRTLNLAPLIGAVLRDDYVPARAVLLTEWR